MLHKTKKTDSVDSLVHAREMRRASLWEILGPIVSDRGATSLHPFGIRRLVRAQERARRDEPSSAGD